MLLVSATLLCAYAPPPVDTEHSLQGNVTQCLLTNCAPSLKACAADAVCDAGIKCLEKCTMQSWCLDTCIETHLDSAMYAVGSCGAEAGCFNPNQSRLQACGHDSGGGRDESIALSAAPGRPGPGQ